MSINSLNSNSYSSLQDAINAARERNSFKDIKNEKATSAKPKIRKPKQEINSTLFDMLYGTEKREKPQNVVKKGSYVDFYA